MKKILSFVALSALALFSLGGCNSAPDQLLEQTVEQTVKVEPNASISIRNTDGSIYIYGSAGDQLQIRAKKKAYRQDRLDKISVNIKSQPDLVSIDTVYPPKAKFSFSDRSGTVDYVITLPQTCSISHADLSNGDIAVQGMRGKVVRTSLVDGRLSERNCFSDVQALVGNGSLDVIYDWWEKTRVALDAKIVSGDTRAFIPGKASFHLVVGTSTGNISNDFAEQADRRGQKITKLDAFVGAASDSEIKLQATSGDIRIAKTSP